MVTHCIHEGFDSFSSFAHVRTTRWRRAVRSTREIGIQTFHFMLLRHSSFVDGYLTIDVLDNDLLEGYSRRREAVNFV